MLLFLVPGSVADGLPYSTVVAAGSKQGDKELQGSGAARKQNSQAVSGVRLTS